MKKKYLIALDMDGTLLNSQREISEATREYLKGLNKEGYPIVITSGRPLRAIKPYYESMSLNSPIICYNGTYIYSPNDKSIEERHLLPCTVIKDLIKFIGEENFENILCENDKDIYMLKTNDALLGFFWKDGMNIHYGSFDDMNENMYIMIIQMKDHNFDDKLVKIGFSYPNLGIRFWSGEGLTSELYFLEYNKAAALRSVANKLGVSMENIIAFGDAENDLEMLEECGISVAMKNAKDNIKNQAKYVSIEDNDHDGIKLTLEYLLKNNK